MRSDETTIRRTLACLCRRFCLPFERLGYRQIPNGHIHETYALTLSTGREVRQFLAQKVNRFVFGDPVGMMRNIDLITQHIRSKEVAPERRGVLRYCHTPEGNSYVILGEGENAAFWRICNFIEDAVTFASGEGTPTALRMAGKAFGRFHRQLLDFNPSLLTETIPHFHDTAYRLKEFLRVAERDPMDRGKNAAREIAVIRENLTFADALCRQIENGVLPLRVTHNDAKTDNVLFDRHTLEPLAVIDLDTCMPGLVCYDFGDTIRFAACKGGENGTDGLGLRLDLELFRACTEGYLSEMGAFLTTAELDSLAIGAAAVTLELAARFLIDYLTGDLYFRTAYPEHNLTRARSQLALFQDMTLRMEEMRAIVQRSAGKRGKQE